MCQGDIPYIDYDIQVAGTNASDADLTFFDLDGEPVASYTDMPLSGTVIYPGASENPQDWPGWRLDDTGVWVPDPTDDRWRDGLTVLVEVNPQATADVEYPPATAQCNSPEVVTTTTSPMTPTPIRRLPPTGSTTDRSIVFGAALVALGIGLLTLSRRSSTN